MFKGGEPKKILFEEREKIARAYFAAGFFATGLDLACCQQYQKGHPFVPLYFQVSGPMPI